MSENLAKLYGNLSGEGSYTKSYKEFVGQMKEPAYRDRLFGNLTEDKSYTNSRDAFEYKYMPRDARNSEAVKYTNEELEQKDVGIVNKGNIGDDPLLLDVDKLKGETKSRDAVRPVGSALMSLPGSEGQNYMQDQYGSMGFNFKKRGDGIVVSFAGAENLYIPTDGNDNSDANSAKLLNEYMAKHGKPTKEDIESSWALPKSYEAFNKANNGQLSDEKMKELREEATADMDGSSTMQTVSNFFKASSYSTSSNVPLSMLNEALGGVFDQNRKHFDGAVDYYNQLQEKDPEAYKKAIGEGSLKDAIRDKALDYNIKQRVENAEVQRVTKLMSEFSAEEDQYLTIRSFEEKERAKTNKQLNEESSGKVDFANEAIINERSSIGEDIDNINKRAQAGDKIDISELMDIRSRSERLVNSTGIVNKAKTKIYDNLLRGYESDNNLDDLARVNNHVGSMFMTLSGAVRDVQDFTWYMGGLGAEATGNFMISDGNSNGKSMGKKLLMASKFAKIKSDTYEKKGEELKALTRPQTVGYNGVADATGKLLIGVVENAPMLAMAAGMAYVTGGSSLPYSMAVFGLSGFAGEHKSMSKEMDQAIKDGKPLPYTNEQMILAPLMVGGFEAVTMVPEYFMMKGAAKGILGKFAEEGADKLQNSFFSGVGKSIMGFGKSQASELTQEVFTQVGQNGVKRFYLDDKTVHLTDGLDADFLIKTFGSTGAFHVGPRALSSTFAMMHGMSPESVNKRLNKQSAVLADAQSRLDNVNDMITEEKDPAKKKALEVEKFQLESEVATEAGRQELMIKSIQNKWGSMNTKGINMLRKLAISAGILKQKAAAIKADTGLTRKQKRQQLKELEKEFAVIEGQKEQLINHDKSYQLENHMRVRSLENKARQALKEKNPNKTFTDAQVEKKAQDIWFEEGKKKDTAVDKAKRAINDNLVKFESEVMIAQINELDPTRPIKKIEASTLKEAKEQLVKNLEAAGVEQIEINHWVDQLEQSWESASANIIQANIPGQKVNKNRKFDKHQIMIVNSKKAQKGSNLAARGHEILHAVVWKAFKTSGKGFKTMAESMVKVIGKTDQEGSDWLMERMRAYDPKDDNYFEEVIMAISDGMRMGEIQLNEDTQLALKAGLDGAMAENGMDNALINNAQDMLDLIAKYNRSLATGKLDNDIKNLIKGKVKVSKKLNVKEQKKQNAKIKKSMDMLSKPAREVLTDAIEASRKVAAEAVNNVFGKFRNESIGSFDALGDIGNAYDAMFNKAIKRFENEHNVAFGQDQIDQFKFEAIYGDRGIRGALMYDPKNPRVVFDENVQVVIDGEMQNNTPAKYLNGLLPQRMIEFAVKAIPNLQEYYAKDISDMKDLEASETADMLVDRTEEFKRDKRSLTDLSVVKEKAVKIINEVVKSIIKRALASPLQTAVETINAIEEKINKDLFKLIKEEMGGIHQYGKSKLLVISEEYKSFWDLEFQNVVKGLPIKTIKRKYNNLFSLKKIGRELTPQGNAIYDVKVGPKAEFINFFIKGKYTTLKNKQASIAKEIAQALAAEAAYEVLKDPEVLKTIAGMQEIQGFTSMIGIENEIKEIGNNLDKKKGEGGKFDNIKLSKDIGNLSTQDRQKFYDGLPDLSEAYGSKRSFDSAFEQAYPAPLFGKYRKNIKKDIIRYMKLYEVDIRTQQALKMKPLESIETVIRNEVKMQDEKTTLEKMFNEEQGNFDFLDLKKLDNVYSAVIKIAEKLGPAKAKRFLYFLHNSGKVGGTSAIRNKQGLLEYDPTFFAKKIFDVSAELGKIELDENGKPLNAKDAQKIKRLEKQIAKYQKELEAGNEPTKHRYGVLKNAAELAAIIKNLVGDTKDIPSNIAQKLDKANNSNWSYEKDLESAERNREILLELSDVMMELRDAAEISNTDIGMILMSLNSSMNSPLAAAANLRYLQDGQGKFSTEKHRYEHLTPRKVIQMIMAGYISGQIPKAEFKKALSEFHVAIIEKTQDDVVNKYYKSSLPPGVINMLDRYFNIKTHGEINMVLIDAKTNKPVQKSVSFKKAHDDLNFPEIKRSADMQRAIDNYNPNETKGISVFDFDETAGISDNVVIARKDGVTMEITSSEWPNVGDQMVKEGWVMDFSDFNKITNGRPGPLMQKLKNQIKKYGVKDVFILTARAPQSQQAIHAYLKSEGISLPIENITGLGNSTGEAKADWFIDKIAEGYNDVYFVDDAMSNVKAVDFMLKQFDIKSKSVQARIKSSKDMDGDFNKIIEQNEGVGFQKRFKRSSAKSQGKGKGFFSLWIPPGAEDFMGLMYKIATAKGKIGEAQLKFFKDNILKPYQEGINNLNKTRQAITRDYKALLKAFPNVKNKLNDLVPGTTFTYDAAIRVYLWDKAGFEIPETSKAIIKALTEIVKNDPELVSFAESVSKISRRPEGYVKPDADWVADTIISDLDNAVNKVGRKEFLTEFLKNKDIIFSTENLNKIEATYGVDYREALEDMLHRMTTGRNRTMGAQDRQVNRWTEWITNSIGAIMFLNMRSAVLQLMSTVNFINWSDNNPVKAAAAFANQKVYWSTFMKIFNSDFLLERRSGLKMDVNEAQLASALNGKKNKAKALLALLLKKGFTPTQIADSFAIASGGATFLINRTKTYLKQGMSQAQADAQAFEDFTAKSNESQQSSDPSLISKQQASVLGRFILAFQNTPMQYARLMKKAGVDLIKGRGDWKTNVSRIIYYGAVQNIIFAGLQSAMFALAFSDVDDDELDKKTDRLTNTVVDSLLRGTGIYGAVLATAKNIMLEFYKQDEKGWKADHAYTLLQFANISPPIGSKMRKLYSATQTRKFNKEVMKDMGMSIDNPMVPAIGTGIEAFTNIPLGRAITKINNAREALNDENDMWQRIALMMGWNTWDIGVKNQIIEDKKKSIKMKKKNLRGSKKTGGGSRTKNRVKNRVKDR